MKITPLFYYPTTTIWVDDDQTLLSALTLVFSDQFKIKPFQSPVECLTYLKTYKSPLSEINFLKGIQDDENFGALQYLPINFDITNISELINNKNKINEISSMVIDFNMPGMNGFELAKSCEQYSIEKILLTGGPNDVDAITGFNNNLIRKFVKKSDDKMEVNLRTFIHELSVNYFEEISRPLLSHLETENKMPLSDPVFIDFFEEFCKAENVCEFYLIDKQGSFLCSDNNGSKFILIIQTNSSLDSWLSTYSSELDEVTAKEIRTREKIVFFGIGKEMWDFNPENMDKQLYSANVLEGREPYYWTKIKSE